jgi:hypothetical protein
MIDASPEPVTNALATTAELGIVALLGWALWNHPWISLALAIALLAATLIAVRALARALGRLFRSLWERAAVR